MKAHTRPARRFGAEDMRPECSLCCKIAFGNEGRANLAARKATARSWSGAWFRAYYKPDCGWWHIARSR